MKIVVKTENVDFNTVIFMILWPPHRWIFFELVCIVVLKIFIVVRMKTHWSTTVLSCYKGTLRYTSCMNCSNFMSYVVSVESKSSEGSLKLSKLLAHLILEFPECLLQCLNLAVYA